MRRKPAARKRAPRGKAWPAGVPDEEIYTLSDLEQIKVLADPLRIRILELLGEERTTKQVAGILSLPPTRLYHHVAALERVGLVRLTRTRQSRGALEKYYLAVAKAFSADPRLFSPATFVKASRATQAVAAQMLENTAAEIRSLLRTGEGPGALQQGGILSYLEVRGTPKQLGAIRDRLARILKDCTRGQGKSEPSKGGYRLTIAYFPLKPPQAP